ncbi:MAG: TetR/AcrR family transcriptional regulator [Rhizobiales bacterium]|nr:TetR/AcrR family transcriptional regulator [Hyphomicrobiales bacterium]
MPKIVDKNAIRNDIMDAALKMYALGGYHATSMSVIAKAANMAKGKLYIYFESKEALTIAMVDRHFAHLENRIISAKPCSSLDELMNSLRLTMEVPVDKVPFIKVFFEIFGPSFSSEEFSEHVAGFFDRVGSHYAGQITTLQSLGQIAPHHDASSLGRAIASMLDGMILHHGLFNIPVKRHKQMVADALAVLKAGMNT